MLRVFCGLMVLFFGPPAFAQPSLIDRAQGLKESLVMVKTVYVRGMRSPRGLGLASYERNGAGIIIDPSGLVVTNTHTIRNAPHIFIILNDGTKLEAQLAYVSPDYDFSFLKINAGRPLKPVPWADSSRIRLGEEIVAVGNGDYVKHSILSGEVISVLQSHTSGSNEFIETSLNLYKGDSGGAILNRQGQLLGIVMGKAKSKDHSSLAIAADLIRKQYLLYLRKIQ